MNTVQLECFIAVAENLNFAKAAELVHMSQPAVSKKIQSLEEELDVLLFERDTRHVILTTAGKQFYANAKSILLQEQSAIANMAQLKAQQKISLIIGSHNTEIYGYLGRVLAEVYQETRDMQADIIEAPFQSLNMSLKANSVDIVIGTYEIMGASGLRDAAFRLLVPSPVYCVVSANKNTDRYPKTLKMSDLAEARSAGWLMPMQRITCADLDRYLAGVPGWQKMIAFFSRNTLVCDNVDAVLCMVEAGLGMMIFPEPDFRMNERFHYIPVTDAPLMHYGYFYNPENRNPLLGIFRKKLEAYFADNA